LWYWVVGDQQIRYRLTVFPGFSVGFQHEMISKTLLRRWLQRLTITPPSNTLRRAPWHPFGVQTLELRALLAVSVLNNSGQGYAGLSFNQSGGYTPPDTNGAAGPNAYVETVNQKVALYADKSTGAGATTDSLSHFLFTTGGLTRADSGSGLSDPVITYDEKIGRFIIGDQDVNFSTHVSAFDLAVSKSDNPATLTAADWTFYKIVTTQANEDADYPGNFGYNADALVFTLNMFAVNGTTGTYHVQVVSVDATDLTNAAASPHVYKNNLSDFNVRPTTMHDSVAGDPMWLVTDHGDGQSIDVFKMTGELTNAAVFKTTNLAVTSYLQAIPPLNPNGTDITDNVDSRIIKAAEANNILVACHAVAVSATQEVAQWYAINVGSGTPVLSQQGQVGAGNNTYISYPAIDVSTSGAIGMSYMRSGNDTSSDYMSMWVTGRLSTDAAGTMETPVLVPNGTGLANYSDFANPHRAGDLSGINVDPVDGSFWAANEFANTQATANWGTAIANFSVASASSGASKLAFQQAPPVSGTAGVALSPAITVAVQDGSGNVVTADGSNVTLTLSSGSFSNGSTTVTVAAVSGVATFSSLTINAAGSYTLTASDGMLTAATSGSFTINPAAASQTAFQSIPATGTAGVALSPSVKVAVLDVFGNVVTGNTSTVTLSIATGPGVFAAGSTLSVAAVNGVATFSNLKLNTAGAYTLKAADGTLTVPTSGSFTINPAAASRTAFQSIPATGTAGTVLPSAVKVAVLDAFGNVVTSDTSTVTLSVSTGPGVFAAGSTLSVAAVSGIATFNNLKLKTAGTYTLKAIDGSLTAPTSGTITINPAAASKLAYSRQPPASGTAGVALSPAIKVVVQDQFGNLVTGNNSTVTLTLSSGTFSNGATTVSVAASGGVATFSSLIVNTVGSYTLAASNGTLTSATSATFAIAPAPASQLVFQSVPTTGSVGVLLATAITVAVEDAFGNVATGDTSTVSLSVASGPGDFTGGSTLSVAAVNGIATFSNLALNTAGNYTLNATDGTLTATTSGTITINSAASASKLAFEQYPPTSGTAGVALSPAITVAVEDLSGNVVTGDSSSVTLTLSSGTFANGSTTVTVAAVSGVSTFSSLIINTVGSYTLTASDGGLTAATSGSVAINPAAASQTIFQSIPTTGTAGVVLSTAVKVAVEDAFGNVVTSDTSTVTLSLASGPGVFASGSTLSVSAVKGIATFSNLMLNTAGAYTLNATDGSLTVPTSGTITINPAAASQTVFQSIPTTGTAGTVLTAVKVTVEDAFGNIVTGDKSTVALRLASGPGVFASGSTLSVAAVKGIASFSNLTLNTSGAYTLNATDGSLTVPTSATITINPAAASQTVFQSIPTTGTAGVVLAAAVQVAVEDTFGNVVTSDASTVSVSVATGPGSFAAGSKLSVAAVNGVATFNKLTLNTSGTYTLNSVDGSLTVPTSGAITINPAAAAQLAFLQQPPATGTAGVALSPAITVAVEDQFGNLVTSDNSTVTLTLSSGTFSNASTTVAVAAVGGVATYSNLVINTAGSYTLTASDRALATVASGSVAITPAAASQLVIQSYPTTGIFGIVLGSPVNVAVEDAFGNIVTGDTSTVALSVATGPGDFAGTSTLSVAAVNGVATFNNLLLNTAGTYTFAAADGSLTAATTGSITINATLVPKLVLQQAPATGTAGVAFSPTVKVATLDQFGNLFTTYSIVTLTLNSGTFSTGQTTATAGTSGGIATFSSLNIRIAGSYTVTASDGVMNGTSFGITINPAAANKLAFQQAPPMTGTAGTALIPAVTVAEEDSYGNLISTDNSSSVTLTLSTGTFATGSKTTTAQVAGGVATFSGLIFNKVGSYKLTASDGALTPVTSGNITIAAAAMQLVVLQSPSNGTAGVAFAQAVKVAVQDQFGNLTTTYSVVTLTLSTGTFSTGLATVSAGVSGGMATFNNLTIITAGNSTISASDGNLPGTSFSVTIAPAAASKLAFQQSPPASGTTGVTLSPAVTVAVEDAYGNVIVTDNSSTVTLTLNTGIFANGNSTASAAAVNGVATFSGLVINTAGNYTLTASDGSLTTVTSGIFAINPPVNSAEKLLLSKVGDEVPDLPANVQEALDRFSEFGDLVVAYIQATAGSAGHSGPATILDVRQSLKELLTDFDLGYVQSQLRLLLANLTPEYQTNPRFKNVALLFGYVFRATQDEFHGGHG
jgi:hypothetical protein